MRAAPLTVGVIGGGFTGAASAIACLARLPEPFRLVLIEPSAVLGRGVAYGSHHPLHLLNVRTRDLSIRASQPGDFLNWAFRQLDQGENHAGLHDALAHTFLPRQLFGEYVRQRLFETVEQRADVEFSVMPTIARALRVKRGGYVIELDRGENVRLRRRDPRHRLWRARSSGARRARTVRAASARAGCERAIDRGDRIGANHGRRADRRAARRLPGHRDHHLATRTIAAPACREGRRAPPTRFATLEARVDARGFPQDRLRDCGGRRRTLASRHQWLAVIAAGRLARAPRQ